MTSIGSWGPFFWVGGTLYFCGGPLKRVKTYYVVQLCPMSGMSYGFEYENSRKITLVCKKHVHVFEDA